MGFILSKSLKEELGRHNREIQRTCNYIRGKQKKSEFGLCVIGNHNIFYEQALEAVQGIKSLWTENAVDSEYDALEATEMKNPRGPKGAVQTIIPSDRVGEKPTFLCHDDLDRYHVLMGPNCTTIIEYNRIHLGIQAPDLCWFMRKVVERHGWNMDLRLSMLDPYERIPPMDCQGLTCLYYPLLYPKKYWKQPNFYYNANKAWIPGWSIDKLHGLEKRQQQRNHFLKRLQADCGV